MTVNELIERLGPFPGDHEVVLVDEFTGYLIDLSEVREQSISHGLYDDHPKVRVVLSH